MTISNVNKDWTPEVKTLIVDCSVDGGVLRKFMSSNEIKLANKLVELDALHKGTSDDKQKSVCFFTEEKYKS